MSNSEETINRRAKRKKVRKEQSSRIELAWVKWVESHPPYEPGDLMPPPREKKRNDRSKR